MGILKQKQHGHELGVEKSLTGGTGATIDIEQTTGSTHLGKASAGPTHLPR